MTQAIIKNVVIVIEQHFNDHTFTVEKLMTIMGYSRGYAWESIKNSLGASPLHLIETRRLIESLRYIAEGMCACEIHLQIGYSSSKSFRRAFKRRLGICPTECREMLKEETKIEQIEELKQKLKTKIKPLNFRDTE